MSLNLYKIIVTLFITVTYWIEGCNGECDLMPGAPQVCVKGWSPWTQCTSTGDYKMDAAVLKAQLNKINARLPFAYFGSTLESKMMQEKGNLDEYVKAMDITLSGSNMTKPAPYMNTTRPTWPQPMPGCQNFSTNYSATGGYFNMFGSSNTWCKVVFNFTLDHQRIIINISVCKYSTDIFWMNGSNPYIIQFRNSMNHTDGMHLYLKHNNGKSKAIVRDMHVSRNGSFEMDAMHNFRVLGSVENADWVNVSISRECGTDPKNQDIDLCQYPVYMLVAGTRWNSPGPEIQLPQSLFHCAKPSMKIDLKEVARLLHETINMLIVECGRMDPITSFGSLWVNSGLADIFRNLTGGSGHEAVNMNDYKTSTAEETMIGKGSASVSASAKGQGVASTSGRITITMGPHGKPIVHVSGNATGDHTSVVIKPTNKTSNHSIPANGTTIAASCGLLKDLMQSNGSSINFNATSNMWIQAVIQMVEQLIKTAEMRSGIEGGMVGNLNYTNNSQMVWNMTVASLHNAHMCGFCYRRFRACRDEFMSWLDQKLESEPCEESNQPCVVPPLRDTTCNYDQFLLPDTEPQVSPANEGLARKMKWRLNNKWMNTMGTNQTSMHCAKMNGVCHCCCGAYVPVITSYGVPICRKHMDLYL